MWAGLFVQMAALLRATGSVCFCEQVPSLAGHCLEPLLGWARAD